MVIFSQMFQPQRRNKSFFTQNSQKNMVLAFSKIMKTFFLKTLKSVSFKKAVEISSTQEICTEFTHIIYCIWVNSVQISLVGT